MIMDNLSITDECVGRISNGIVQGACSPLRILSLAGNLIGHRSLNAITALMRSGLKELNLSGNPLSGEFFMQVNNLRMSTVRVLDLADVGMDS